jgi:hypothetical protein
VRPSCSCRRQCRAPVIEPAWLGSALLAYERPPRVHGAA